MFETRLTYHTSTKIQGLKLIAYSQMALQFIKFAKPEACTRNLFSTPVTITFWSGIQTFEYVKELFIAALHLSVRSLKSSIYPNKHTTKHLISG